MNGKLLFSEKVTAFDSLVLKPAYFVLHRRDSARIPFKVSYKVID